MAEVVAAIVGAFLSGIIAWSLGRSKSDATVTNLNENVKRLNLQLEEVQNENTKLGKDVLDLSVCREINKELKVFKDRYNKVRSALEQARVVRYYYQPVIIMGPRSVGKTSLMMQWYAPWNEELLEATYRHKYTNVPVHNHTIDGLEPHFADQTIKTTIEAHLGLKIHDFPGEKAAQDLIKEVAIQETGQIRTTTNKKLGIVLICMFDASEFETGISASTNEYYNGEFFKDLRRMVADDSIEVDRLILVFNKYDKLLASRVGKGKIEITGKSSDDNLLKEVVDKFKDIFTLFSGVCHPGKVCEVFSMLSREDMRIKNMGAPIIKGEASRKFVEAFAGNEVAANLVKGRASTFSSKHVANY